MSSNGAGGGIQYQPSGCICPPTSEMTCQSSACPRKGSSRFTEMTFNLNDPDVDEKVKIFINDRLANDRLVKG
jgi:hypothetical protein